MLEVMGRFPTEESLSIPFEDLLALPLAPSVQRPLFAALLPLLQRRADSDHAQNLVRQIRLGILAADLQRCREEALAGRWREAFDRLTAQVLPCRREGEQPALQDLQLELVHRFCQELVPIDGLSGQALAAEADCLWALQAVLTDLQNPEQEHPPWFHAADRQLTLRSLAVHLGLDQGSQALAAWRLEQRLLELMTRLSQRKDAAPPWVQVHAEDRLRRGIARLAAGGRPVEPSQLQLMNRWTQLLRQLRVADGTSVDRAEPMSMTLLRYWSN